MRIADLDASDTVLRDQLVALTHAAAATHAPCWLPTLADAREELDDATAPDRVARVLFDDDGRALGWGACFHAYGAVWEIHPLLVDVAHHRRGHGARIVADLELQAARRGAGVIFVGTSDETGATSLSGRDLYADPIDAMATMTAAPGHPAGFWLYVGYAFVGIIPDAEGPGRPSLNFAKRAPHP